MSTLLHHHKFTFDDFVLRNTQYTHPTPHTLYCVLHCVHTITITLCTHSSITIKCPINCMALYSKTNPDDVIRQYVVIE